MEFGDAEDDEHDAAARLAKRRKWSQAGGSTAKASSTEQPQKPVKHVPGQLAHADVVPTATATQVCVSCACAVGRDLWCLVSFMLPARWQVVASGL